MKLSVIICTYNRAQLLHTVLHSLKNQSADRSLFEVLVVDNNSNDTTRETVEAFPEFTYAFEPVQGLSQARNTGWERSQGDYVAYLDDDAKADIHWIEGIIDIIAKTDPVPVVIGGPILAWYEIQPPRWFLDEFETRDTDRSTGFCKEKTAFSGSNMIFRRDLLGRFGG